MNFRRTWARLGLLLALVFGLPTCTSGPPPFVGASLVTFSPGSTPPGYRSSASVSVLNSDSGDSIEDASVSINGVTLTYSSSAHAYQGDVTVVPGSEISLEVAAGGSRYPFHTAEFTAYPAIVAPPAGSAWATSCDIPVQWSGGAPITSPQVLYAVGVLDAANPDGDPVWPVSGGLELEPISTMGAVVPRDVLTVGDKFLVVGITSQQPIPGADSRSVFILGAFSFIPISITGTPDAPVSITVAPALVPIEMGTTQQFTATGTFCDGTTADLSQTVMWNSSKPGVATVTGQGLALGVSAGTTELSAHLGPISGSLPVTVTRRWVSQTSNAGGHLLAGVTWTGSQFVAVGEGGTIVTSSDGVTWILQASGTPSELMAIGASGSHLVATEYNSGTVHTSPDGVHWTSYPTSDTVQSLLGVTGSGTQFVAVGNTASDGAAVLTSPDGVAWTAQDAGVSTELAAVVWSGTQFVAVGGAIVTSPDGITWTRRTIPGNGYFLSSVAWSGTQFVAAAASPSAAILTSPDGVNWTVQGCAVGYGFMGVGASNDTVIAVGPPQGIFSSSDGQDCILNPIDQAFTFWGVSWSGTLFVVVGAYGMILTSP